MFIKQLIIEDKMGIIRTIDFHKGLNLILDETPISHSDDMDKTTESTKAKINPPIASCRFSSSPVTVIE